MRNSDLANQLTKDITNCICFSLQFDESVVVIDISQPCIFFMTPSSLGGPDTLRKLEVDRSLEKSAHPCSITVVLNVGDNTPLWAFEAFREAVKDPENIRGR
ncbi:hypothetical protein TNCV_756621 [Trichonephila clavipes]|nr:hypothetical protein TNCV_756621 [Trichonephila clavipes]